ncbi:MAG: hypothetical protein K2P78_11630 [Gemmataceae bacterium]|nr:hypothetical protein [Gemmataceae bacterium]
MSAAKPPSEALLARAAELRAGGATWDAVAARLNRSADTVRKWPVAYPDRWHAALHAAERRLVAEAGAESVLVLRSLLRSDDEKVRRDAAKFLIDLRLELARLDAQSLPEAAPPPLTSAARDLVAFLEGHSDDDLARLAANLFPAPVADRPGPDGGPH